MLLKTRVPWDGRAEDKNDDSVWSVTCFVTRVGFRRGGGAGGRARGAIDFGGKRGAAARWGRTDWAAGQGRRSRGGGSRR